MLFFCFFAYFSFFFGYDTAAVLPVVLLNIVIHSFFVFVVFSAVLRYCCAIIHTRGGSWNGGWWVDTATAVLLCTGAL